ncbi:MAG: GAF domain-containing protein, partial [Candidatus Omnitrophota bacterium]|nr:GAF domain-containing protein [Candidatus Omnitrophota bacterium]
MAGFLKKLSLVPTGLRYKLTIAFVLMSIIPLAIGVYLAWNYIFWDPKYPWDITDVSLLLVVTVVIALLGFKVSKDIISPIIEMALKAKVIANGDLSQSIDIKSEDEIGQLGSTLNVLTRRIRENMDELRSYGERTKEINVEISKKVLVLSGLLQIGNLISQGSSLDQILDLIIEKVSQLEDEGAISLLLIEDKDTLVTKITYNLKNEGLKTLKLKLGTGFLGRCVSEGKILVLDRRSKLTKESGEFLDSFGLRNCVIAPVTIHGQGIGVLCFGNAVADYEFKNDDVELLKLFTRQIAIAVENEKLTKKAKELSIKDELTGLYNEKYITGRLDEEIKRAIVYQRPCSFAILNIDDFILYRQEKGELVA